MIRETKSEVTIERLDNGHDGPGWYWHFTDYPEEGIAGAFKSFDEARESAERNDGSVATTEVDAEQRAELAETAIGEWEDWALSHCDPNPDENTDDEKLRALIGERIASLESQLATAKAEAREAALREAFAVVVEAFDGESHERHPALFRAYCTIADKLVGPVSPPPPRVDGWIPVGDAHRDGNEWLAWCGFATLARFETGDWWRVGSFGLQRCHGVTHVHAIPAPPTAARKDGSDV